MVSKVISRIIIAFSESAKCDSELRAHSSVYHQWTYSHRCSSDFTVIATSLRKYEKGLVLSGTKEEVDVFRNQSTRNSTYRSELLGTSERNSFIQNISRS
jgi:hypothetical protein